MFLEINSDELEEITRKLSMVVGSIYIYVEKGSNNYGFKETTGHVRYQHSHRHTVKVCKPLLDGGDTHGGYGNS